MLIMRGDQWDSKFQCITKILLFESGFWSSDLLSKAVLIFFISLGKFKSSHDIFLPNLCQLFHHQSSYYSSLCNLRYWEYRKVTKKWVVDWTCVCPCIVVNIGSRKPARFYTMFYRTSNLLNMFRACLCPSSGARVYMCVITSYGVQCPGCWLLEVGCRTAGYAFGMSDVARATSLIPNA